MALNIGPLNKISVNKKNIQINSSPRAHVEPSETLNPLKTNIPTFEQSQSDVGSPGSSFPKGLPTFQLHAFTPNEVAHRHQNSSFTAIILQSTTIVL